MKKNILFALAILVTFFSIQTIHGMQEEQRIEALSTSIQDEILMQKLTHDDLIEAIRNDKMLEVEALIASGVDIRYRDHNGRTALHEAIKQLNINIIILLLRYGANTEVSSGTDESVLSYADGISAIERLQSLQSSGNPERTIIARNIVVLLSKYGARRR